MTDFLEPGKHSKKWKEWRAVGQGKKPRFFMEHRQAVLESLHGPHKPCELLLSRELFESRPDYWRELASTREEPWYLVDGQKLNQVVSVPNVEGLCAVYEPAPATEERLKASPFTLLGWEIQDPGNAGTLIRTASALGVEAVVLVGGCNPWSAKVARASAGALLRLPLIWHDSERGTSLLEELAHQGVTLYRTVPRGGIELADVDWGSQCTVLLGNESHGLPPSLEGFGTPVTIPMTEAVESLNVAVTGALVAYQWALSRRVGV